MNCLYLPDKPTENTLEKAFFLKNHTGNPRSVVNHERYLPLEYDEKQLSPSIT